MDVCCNDKVKNINKKLWDFDKSVEKYESFCLNAYE